MQISDERLAELTQLYAKEQEDARPWVGEVSVEAHVHAALMELAALRRPVVQGARIAAIRARITGEESIGDPRLDALDLLDEVDAAQREIQQLKSRVEWLTKDWDQADKACVSAQNQLAAAQKEIARLQSPPEERREIAQRLAQLREISACILPGSKLEACVSDIDTLLADNTRSRNAYDDRVRMLGFVQDELVSRNKDKEDLTLRIEQLQRELNNIRAAFDLCSQIIDAPLDVTPADHWLWNETHERIRGMALSTAKLMSDNAEYAQRHLAQLQRIERLEGALNFARMDIEASQAAYKVVSPASAYCLQKVKEALAAADGQQT